jgi:uncharacterized membrane protein YgdD (TMEM256/DUF423 family)
VKQAGGILGGAAACLGGVGVAAGAYAAHGLGADPHAAALLETASRYQVWHALAALIALLVQPPARPAAILFLSGSVLFSWSIAALAFGAPSAVGYLTPVGGVAFILGWLVLATVLLTRTET